MLMVDLGFPRRDGGMQTIICPIFPKQLHETEDNLVTVGGGGGGEWQTCVSCSFLTSLQRSTLVFYSLIKN